MELTFEEFKSQVIKDLGTNYESEMEAWFKEDVSEKQYLFGGIERAVIYSYCWRTSEPYWAYHLSALGGAGLGATLEDAKESLLRIFE